ncbi:N-acetylglucosaminyl-phosphatidylinositol biosynthetic protein gpi1-like isoform X2 [Mercurialis annua]|uniref:N-acetylglucosaminyl-phosphatidylinositol biosynthetic protein gpi1-like isoform X2 n=1 Tax=Mercurialis annua TaxID=3986 RepID=UPI00215F5B0B|nr:N-acetylglucosaminyl-phosphatidylinositol biosynthetic protein gpi1-like isoform X2 [Mercurialis annua]
MEEGVVGAINLTDYRKRIRKLMMKIAVGSIWYMILMNNMVETFIGFLSCITSIGMGKYCHNSMSTYVIAYETPIYGLHHFSLNSWNLFEQVNAPMKKPKWVDELERNRHLLDLDTVVLAINCATAAAKIVIDKHMDSKRSYASFSIIYLSTAFIRHVFAISAASVSTLYYVVLQLICNFSHMGCKTEIYKALARILCTTCTNIQIRCCQFSYWPIFLQDNGLRSQSCVEFEENAAFLRHSMWSSLVVDLLLGNLFGLPLLFNAESAYLWLSTLSRDITNDLLRSGCVWLMGVPAGFKLNTELAGVLGMISLNVIQIWSTLWTLAGSLLIYFIKGFAVFGIIFGATIPAALVMDMISLATFHLSILHCAMSLLYSWQIQALAALWRLFRGRKWNPLRHRLDSYDYTVKQHTVGSLLFTPLLLLLPTTSVFYIFFTILNATITFICAFFELSISLIHGTPYSKILLWLVRRRRFPSGIWFEIVSCHIGSLEIVFPDKTGSSHDNSQKDMDTAEERSTIVVSALHSNFLSLGELVFPHYKKIFSGVLSFVISSAHGALIGTRTSSTLGTGLPPIYPRMIIPGKEYWCLCYNSILSCTTKHDRHLGQ